MAIRIYLEDVLKARGMTSKQRQGQGRAIPHHQPHLLFFAVRRGRHFEI